MLHLPSAPRVFVPGFLRPFRKRKLHVLHANSWHTDGQGRMLWVENAWVDNILHDEGEQALLSAYFDTDLAGYGPPPANLYLRLDNRASLAEADTLASISGEPATGGYGPKAISTTSGFTLTQPAEHYQAATATLTFTATGGNFGEVRNRFLATSADGTGKLICSLELQLPRTINQDDSLGTSLTIGFSE